MISELAQVKFHSLSLNLVVRLPIESLFLRRLILDGQEGLGLIIGETFQAVLGIHSLLPKSSVKTYFSHVFMLLLWLIPASLGSNLDWVISIAAWCGSPSFSEAPGIRWKFFVFGQSGIELIQPNFPQNHADVNMATSCLTAHGEQTEQRLEFGTAQHKRKFCPSWSKNPPLHQGRMSCVKSF